MAANIKVEGNKNNTSLWYPKLSYDYDSLVTAFEEIDAIYEDYKMIRENQIGSFKSIVPMGIYEKSSTYPAEYFQHLANCALMSSNPKIKFIVSEIKAPLAEDLSLCFRNWFNKICEAAMSFEFVIEKEFFTEDNEPDFSAVTELALDYDSVADLARASNDLGTATPEIAPDDAMETNRLSVSSADSSSTPTSSPKQTNSKCALTSIKDNNDHIQRRKRVKYVNEPHLSICIIPKGVYATLHGYRVQLNIKPNPKTYVKVATKFSRNCKLYESAIWLYEVMIFISDCPTHLYDLLNIGNYDAMLCAKVIPSASNSVTPPPLIYLNIFKHQIVALKQANILTVQEYMTAMQLLPGMDDKYEYPGLLGFGNTHKVCK